MSLMKLKTALEKQKPFCSAGGGGGGSSSASSSPLKMRTSKITVSQLFLISDYILNHARTTNSVQRFFRSRAGRCIV